MTGNWFSKTLLRTGFRFHISKIMAAKQIFMASVVSRKLNYVCNIDRSKVCLLLKEVKQFLFGKQKKKIMYIQSHCNRRLTIS